MIRDTSKEAYAEVMSSGYVGRKQKEVYASLYENGPVTGGELHYRMSLSRNPSHSNIVTRLGELRDIGIVREFPKRTCSKSGYQAYVWDVTSKHPKKPARFDRVKCKHCGGRGYTEQGRLL